MVRDISVIGYLPEVLQEVKELKALDSVENPILEEEWKLAYEQLDNGFVETANEFGLSRYEKMLKLKVSDLDTIETRRLRVLTRFQEQAPYSYKAIINILNTILGEGNYTFQRDVANKTVNMKIQLTIANQFAIIEDFLERVLPVNMNYNIELMFNTWDKFKTQTWGNLVTQTWDDVKEGI